MSILELFCDVDDFMLSFAAQCKATQLKVGKQRERAGHLCPSEVMTILIHFHQSHYRTFKAYYTQHVQVYLTSEFPQRVALSALCCPDSTHDSSSAGLFAEPIWELYWDQLHCFDGVARLSSQTDQSTSCFCGRCQTRKDKHWMVLRF